MINYLECTYTFNDFCLVLNHFKVLAGILNPRVMIGVICRKSICWVLHKEALHEVYALGRISFF